MAEAERRRPQNVAAGRFAELARGAGASGWGHVRAGEAAHQLVEGLGRAPVLLALIGGQFERDHRDRQSERASEARRIVLDQFPGAGGADEHGGRPEALIGVERGALEQIGGVATEIARLEGGVGHRRALAAPLDHGEEQVSIGVALRGVQDVMHVGHRGGDPHRADMRGAFIGPDGELHGYTSSAARRFNGRANSSARSPACSKPWGEDELDRPFGRQALRLQRIGEAEPADGDIGRRR